MKLKNIVPIMMIIIGLSLFSPYAYNSNAIATMIHLDFDALPDGLIPFQGYNQGDVSIDVHLMGNVLVGHEPGYEHKVLKVIGEPDYLEGVVWTNLRFAAREYLWRSFSLTISPSGNEPPYVYQSYEGMYEANSRVCEDGQTSIVQPWITDKQVLWIGTRTDLGGVSIISDFAYECGETNRSFVPGGYEVKIINCLRQLGSVDYRFVYTDSGGIMPDRWVDKNFRDDGSLNEQILADEAQKDIARFTEEYQGAVPEPATFLLLVSGLVGLASVNRSKKKRESGKKRNTEG